MLRVIYIISFPFLYPLKTSENLWISDVFRGNRNGPLTFRAFIRPSEAPQKIENENLSEFLF